MSQDRDARKVLHSALVAIQSDAENKSIAALTLDHLIQEQIDYLKSGSTRPVLDGTGAAIGTRLSRWDRLDILEKQMDQLIQSLQSQEGT